MKHVFELQYWQKQICATEGANIIVGVSKNDTRFAKATASEQHRPGAF